MMEFFFSQKCQIGLTKSLCNILTPQSLFLKAVSVTKVRA
jgi:hypothetical protein